MSMGYSANYADVISYKALNEITKGNLEKLTKYLENNDYSLEDFAREVEWDMDEIPADIFETAEKLYQEVQATFEKETGLESYIGYHDVDNKGSCYDDVDGTFFYVVGMYQLSPEGKKLKEVVERKLYATYG